MSSGDAAFTIVAICRIMVTLWSVFDGGVFWKKFSWQVGIRDIFVMGWKAVTEQTKRRYPELSTNIYLAIKK